MLFLIFMFCIALSLSYFLLWLIYRKLFKSQKKISKFLVFIGSIGLIIFYYTPYSFYLEPSYWQFRNMCKLNELPNNEEKYNKILRYFDLSLDTLDWEKLNEKIWKIPEDSGDYKKGVFEYATQTELQQLSSRINGRVYFYSDKSEISQHNTNVMILHILYYTRRYFPAGNEGSGFYWSEERLGCDNADNMTPKGANNEQSRTD